MSRLSHNPWLRWGSSTMITSLMSATVLASPNQAVDVYLLGGQSNATGQGYVRHLPPDCTADPRVRIFHSARVVSGQPANTWQALGPASEDPTRFGPELGFGNRLAELEPQAQVAIIKHAVSDSGLDGDWNPGRGPADKAAWGPEFAVFVATVEAGLQALREEGLEPRLRAMLWQQGEHDAARQEKDGPAAAYAENLGHFIARCREQFAAPDMLFCYGLVLPVDDGSEGRALVRQAQRDVAQGARSAHAVSGALLVDGDDLSLRRDDPATPYPHDGIHFGTAGTYHLGMRMAESIHWERVTRGDLTGDPALDPAPVFWNPPGRYADSVRTFQGIPGIERAPGGRLWATWYTGGTGEGPDNCVVLVSSTDDGASWSPLSLVIDPPGTIRAFDPCLWLDPDGRLWLFYAQSRSWYDGRAGVWAMVTHNPDAAAPTWSPPRRLSHGVMMNKPIALTTGAWLLPVALWNVREGDYADLDPLRRANVVRSHDHGQSWHLAGGAAIPEKRDCDEHMVVEDKDGGLHMFIRTAYGIGESRSTDHGVTWPAATPSAIAHTTSRFFIRRLRSGNWLLVKHGAIDERGGRAHLRAFISPDEGETWKGGLMLDERGGVSYPDGIEAPDGTLRIIYDYSRTGAMEILMAAFTEADVEAGEDVSGRVRRRVLVNKATGSSLPDPDQFTLHDHADGAELLTPGETELRATGGDVGVPFKAGELLFTDRAYRLHSVPRALAGRRFVRSSINGTDGVCEKAGPVYVLTPLPERNADSVQKELAARGFVKAALPEFLAIHLPNGTANLVTVFQKRVEAGEAVRFGKWGVLVY